MNWFLVKKREIELSCVCLYLQQLDFFQSRFSSFHFLKQTLAHNAFKWFNEPISKVFPFLWYIWKSQQNLLFCREGKNAQTWIEIHRIPQNESFQNNKNLIFWNLSHNYRCGRYSFYIHSWGLTVFARICRWMLTRNYYNNDFNDLFKINVLFTQNLK